MAFNKVLALKTVAEIAEHDREAEARPAAYNPTTEATTVGGAGARVADIRTQ